MSLAWSERAGRSELASVWAIDIRCDDCGRTKRMQAPEIAGVVRQGTRSLIGLHNRLHCALCRERGGLGRNISITPVSRTGGSGQLA
ncbi:MULTISPECIES: hypothetical protein [unclassified Bosea (in: a-proteobacteria)]|uniref:hypothetical protein n=1 Tax=unclassified Bosea (in: a-proteobacteria) TaxID=2653178 RepID=UPI000F7E817D|nr:MULTISPECIES: hypothetical protein [unclassified Bosea (in: a-proteobacteria)]